MEPNENNVQLPYRPNVGLVVFNSKGQTLVGERLDNRGAWQYPQGGVDVGEDLEHAARRELHEETGITDATILFACTDFLYYDFPPSLKIPHMTDRYRGQKQRWYLAYWNHDIQDTNLRTHTQEFAQVQFMPMAEVTNQIVAFKRAIYAELERQFLPKIEAHLRSNT